MRKTSSGYVIKETIKNIMESVFGEVVVSESYSDKLNTLEYYMEFMECKIDLIVYDDDIRFNFTGINTIENISHKHLLKELQNYYK